MIGCPSCRAPLPTAALGAPGFEDCDGCRTRLRVRLFPAAFRSRAASSGVVAAPDDATCFFHSTKRAAVPCDGCGRFLCPLCDLELAGQHLCPECASRRTADAGEDRFVRERTLWDSLALALAIYPMLMFYFTIFTAPAALFLSIRHWRSPGSLVPRSRVRFVLAILIALAQLGGWVALIGFMIVAANLPEGA